MNGAKELTVAERVRTFLKELGIDGEFTYSGIAESIGPKATSSSVAAAVSHCKDWKVLATSTTGPGVKKGEMKFKILKWEDKRLERRRSRRSKRARTIIKSSTPLQDRLLDLAIAIEQIAAELKDGSLLASASKDELMVELKRRMS